MNKIAALALALALVAAFAPASALARKAYGVCVLNGTREDIQLVVETPLTERHRWVVPRGKYQQLRLEFKDMREHYTIEAYGLNSDRRYGAVERHWTKDGSVRFNPSTMPTTLFGRECEDVARSLNW